MSRRSFANAFALTLCLSALSSYVVAQNPKAAEPDAKQPYELQVVLHLADNPSLTDTFYDRLERELSDGLQADFGDLVHVKIVREHPLLKDILDKGLANALKTVTERNGVKTQFVLIDFNGVDYEIQTCQYDGVTGQPNPVLVVEQERNPIVRREKKRDREFVAKAAALMVERDFGLVASFPAWPQGKTKPQLVQLDFKGSALASLDRWVKKGDVFGVIQVPNGNGASQTIPDAVVVLQDAPKDGVGTGQLFWRYALPPGGNVSYRCVKLGTVAGPLRLRVVKAGPNNTLQPQEIGFQARHTGFSGEKQTLLERRTSAKGLFDAADPKLNLGATGIFDQVAFVSVVEGGGATIRAELPVPILTDQPYVIKLTNQAAADPLADLAKDAWKTNVLDAVNALEYVVRDIQQLATKSGTREEIIKKGQAGLDRASTDYPQLIAKRDELFKMATPAEQREIKLLDERLKRLDTRMKELNSFLGTQLQLQRDEKDPERLEWLAKIEQGKLLEADLEYGKALALYEKVPEKFAPKDLKGHIAQLHKQWDTNDEKFRAARAFIYEVFPTFQDSAAVEKGLPEARRAFDECRRVDNVFAAQKLLSLIGQLLPRLEKEGASLHNANADDAVPIKRLKEVGVGLADLVTDLTRYIDQSKP